mmetsp:Transcript_59827/g.165478  ORF Transcript_59827/g.165478 Transcript_59827/m.165478 type:complete len:94 (-) Transcript_59827:826-1107(-)
MAALRSSPAICSMTSRLRRSSQRSSILNSAAVGGSRADASPCELGDRNPDAVQGLDIAPRALNGSRRLSAEAGRDAVPERADEESAVANERAV